MSWSWVSTRETPPAATKSLTGPYPRALKARPALAGVRDLLQDLDVEDYLPFDEFPVMRGVHEALGTNQREVIRLMFFYGCEPDWRAIARGD